MFQLLWSKIRTGLINGSPGACTSTMFSPFDNWKLIQQCQADHPRPQRNEGRIEKEAYDQPIDGFLEYWRRAKYKGYWRLWAGSGVAAVQNLAAYVGSGVGPIIFPVRFLPDRRENLRLWLALSYAMTLFPMVLTYPWTTVRNLLAVDAAFSVHEPSCSLAEVCRLGPSLFRGLGSYIAKTMIFRVFYFGPLNKMYAMNPYRNYDKKSLKSIFSKFWIAMLADILAGIAAYPFDTVTRRMQISLLSEAPLYTGAWDCLRTILCKEGVGALFAGCWELHLRKVAFATLVMLEASYLRTRGWLGTVLNVIFTSQYTLTVLK